MDITFSMVTGVSGFSLKMEEKSAFDSDGSHI